MKHITPALWAYLFSGITYIISAMFHWDTFVFLAKPIIGSSILFHYFNESRKHTKFLPVIFLLLYFIGGIFNLFEDADVLKYVLILNMLGYSLLIVMVLKKIVLLKYNQFDNINLIYILLSILFIGTLMYLSVFLVFNKSFSLYSYIVTYAVILSVLAVFVSILYAINPENSIVYLLLAVFCYLVCDIFYVIYYYSYDFIFFRLLSILGSVVSYYFIVNYFISSQQEINRTVEI